MPFDYPGIDEDDELQQRNKFALYPPVTPQVRPLNSIDAPDSVMQAPQQKAPALGETAQPSFAEAAANTPQPKWKDYAPPAPHGLARFGHFMASFNPETNQEFNVKPQRRAQAAYNAATNERNEQFGQGLKLEQESRAEANEKSEAALREKQGAAFDTVQVQVGNKTYTVPRKDAEKLFGEGIKAEAGQKKVETQGDTARDVAGTRAQSVTDTNASRERIAAQADKTKREIGMARIAAQKAKDPKAPPEVAKAHGVLEQSISRLNIMQENRVKAEAGDQQAALSLLANHIGMTMGLVPGARINRQIYQEAEDSAPWLQRVEAHFDKDGFLSGVVLTPQQMAQMEDLAVNRLREDRRNLNDTENYYGFHGHTETATPEKPAAKAAPAVGAVEGGHRFKGGDPSKKENWEKVQP